MRESPLSLLPAFTPDAIFAIAAQAKAAGPRAIDGTVGIFLGEDGKPFLFRSVRAAIEEMRDGLGTRSYSYPPLTGLPEYRAAVERLAFGGAKPRLAASIATTGGTGALAVQLRLAKMMLKEPAILLPSPTWANHRQLCTEAGLRIVEVPYVEGGRASVDALVDAVKKFESPVAALLHVGCHNPTGLDYDRERWEALLPVLAERGTVAVLDFAYQGFSSTPEEDAWPVRRAAELGVTSLVCWSASKNHSIYGERAGAALAVVPDEATKKNVEGHCSVLLRKLHSAAATFGQSIVARLQERHRDAWEKDLAEARESMTRKREGLRKALPEAFRAPLDGHGMFAMLPLGKERVLKLRERKVFLTDDGRINVAGIPLARIAELAEHIRAVAV